VLLVLSIFKAWHRRLFFFTFFTLYTLTLLYICDVFQCFLFSFISSVNYCDCHLSYWRQLDTYIYYLMLHCFWQSGPRCDFIDVPKIQSVQGANRANSFNITTRSGTQTLVCNICFFLVISDVIAEPLIKCWHESPQSEKNDQSVSLSVIILHG